MRPYINELFERIEKDDALKGNVKLIGIAAGNDIYEIDLDKKLYEFPVIPDDHFEFHQLVGRPPTPFLIFTRPDSQGRLRVMDSHLGRTEDVDKLFSMVTDAYEKSIPKTEVAVGKTPGIRGEKELTLPIPKKELMEKIKKSLVVKGDAPEDIKQIDLEELGDIYTGLLSRSKKRVFARVVARKIPCVDCHDVFYIYSFDETGTFLQFIPIAISKLDNEDWDEKDVRKMQNNFKGRSLLKTRHYNPKVDAVSSATISSKLIFDGIGETPDVFQKLKDMGYMKEK